MRTVWVEMRHGSKYEHSGDLDIITNENGSLRVVDYNIRNKRNVMGEVFIAAPGTWVAAEMSDEFELPAPASIAELNSRLAAYDAARAAFPA